MALAMEFAQIEVRPHSAIKSWRRVRDGKDFVLPSSPTWESDYGNWVSVLRREPDRAGENAEGESFYSALLAEAHLAAGQVDEASEAIGQARGIVESTGEGWFEADIHRLEGDVSLRRAPRSCRCQPG